MPVYRLGEELVFPPVDGAEDGLVAVGGDLSTERLVLAYSQGLFPWYEEGQPILWHSPDPRLVLLPSELVVSRSLRKLFARNEFEIRLDGAFEAVIRGCAETPRKNDPGTWITSEMTGAYQRLHDEGYAHAIETWSDGELVGGLYGVNIGRVFFGESMFSVRPDASKVALVKLVTICRQLGIELIDCQIASTHLASLGSRQISRHESCNLLRRYVQFPSPSGWACPPSETSALLP